MTALDSTTNIDSVVNKVGALQTWKTSAQGDIDSKASKTTTDAKIDTLEKKMSGEETSYLKTGIASVNGRVDSSNAAISQKASTTSVS